jgi:alpha-tubulin suppressor-like RCC1 family protein
MIIIINLFISILALNASKIPYKTPKIIDIYNIGVNNYHLYTDTPILFFEYNNYYDIKTNMINNHNSIIYYYKPHAINYNNDYIYNFLLIMHSSRLNLPIVTSKTKYFKPFQYSIHDITLYKYNYSFKIIEETIIEKNSLYFLVDNEKNKKIIRI